MAAPRGSSDSGNGLMVVVIVFVALFLIATVGAITAYMKLGDAKTAEEKAISELAEYATSNEIKALKPFVKSSQTVMTQVSSMLSDQAGLLGGPDLLAMDIVTAHLTMAERVNAMFEQGSVLTETLQIEEADIEAFKSQGLVAVIEQLLNQIEEQKVALEANIDAETLKKDEAILALDQANATVADLEAEIADRGNAVAQLQENSAAEMESSLNKYEEELTESNDNILALTAEKNQLLADINELNQKFETLVLRNQKVENQLAGFRPNPEMESEALKADGQIVKVVASQDLVYIDLTIKDPIFVGLTFSVYDSFLGISKGGKGKATVEIIEITDTVTICRITNSDSGNPIMERDKIANLAWDKDKKYNFCVAGEFDFDGDGEIDGDGYQQVTDLIVAWGGNVSTDLDVDSDFLVLGYEPRLPATPTNASSSANVDKYERIKARHDLYIHANTRGEFLNVPTFNLARFINFIGYSEASRL